MSSIGTSEIVESVKVSLPDSMQGISFVRKVKFKGILASTLWVSIVRIPVETTQQVVVPGDISIVNVRIRMSLGRHIRMHVSSPRKWLRDFRGFMHSHGVVVNLLAVLVGVLSGIGAIMFRVLINMNSYFFFDTLLPIVSLQVWGYNIGVVILPALGALIAALITARFTRESRGHGIPQVIESMTFKGGRMRYRVGPVMSIVSSVTIGSGGSAGREGPIAEIGASFGSTTGQVFRLSDKDVELLVVCGLASGIAATFNAPLGGAVFGLEILLRRFELIEAIPVLLACVLGTAFAREFSQYFISFPVLPFAFPEPTELLFYTALGLSFGVLSAGWVKYFYFVEGLFDKGRSVPRVFKVTLGGLLTGLVGLPFFMRSISIGDKTAYGIYGVGYEGMILLLTGVIPIVLALTLGLVKMICTSFTLGSGASGGLLVPSLYMGSMFGGAMGLALNSLAPSLVPEPYAFASVGAATLLAGAYGTPIASIIMIPEMLTSYNLLLPLMLSCSLAHVMARKLLRGSTINTLALERRGIRLRQLGEQLRPDVLSEIQVKDAMTRSFNTVSPETHVKDVARLIGSTGYGAFPVVKRGKLIGIVDYRDVIRVPPSKTESAHVGDIMKPAVTIASNETLAEVVEHMSRRRAHRLIVVDPANKKPIGFLTHGDIIRGYEAVKHGHPVFEANPLKRVKVREVMNRKPLTIQPEEKLKDVYKTFRGHPREAYPVVEGSRLLGVLTYKNLVKTQEDKRERLKVRDLIGVECPNTYLDETLDQVLEKMHRFGIDFIPVVEKSKRARFLGVITTSDIVRGYESVS
jgi:CIC family chloride channel protein